MLKLPSPESRLLKSSFLCFFVVFLFVFYFRPVESEDVWWHLSTGQWIAENGRVPTVDPFAFSNEQTPWLCYHWLGSSILYGIFDAGGLGGLKIFRSLFLVLVIGVFIFFARKRVPFYPLIILAFLMSLGLSNRVWLRPDFFNYLFIQLFLIVLLSYEQDPDRKKLWVLPPLAVLWFNIHIGSFIYGLPLIAIFILAAGIRYGNLSLDAQPSGKTEALKRLKDLGFVFLACWAGVLINPYGIEGFLFPLKTFLFPQHIGFYKISSTIMETQPPIGIFMDGSSFYYFVLFLLGVLVLVLNKQKDKFLLAMLFVIPLFGFLYMARNVGFFTVACVYVIAQGARSAGFYGQWQRWPWSRAIDGLIILGMTVFFAANIVQLYNSKVMFHHQSGRYLTTQSNSSYERLIKQMTASGIRGPVFNSDFLGGQTIWLGYPLLRPFEDARFLDLKRFSSARTIWQNPTGVWPVAEEKYGFKIAIIGRDSKVVEYLNTQPSWQLIAVRGSVVVFVKRGAFDLDDDFAGFEHKLRSITVTPEDREQLRRLAAQKAFRSSNGRLFSAFRMIEPLNSALTLMGLGYKGAAVKSLLEAAQTNEPIIHTVADSFLTELP